MSIFNRNKYYEALFLANNPNDASNVEKELVAIIAMDLAIAQSVKAKKIKEFKPGMISLQQDHYGIDNLSTNENDLFVEQAKALLNNISKGISVDAGLYSIRLKKEHSDMSNNYRVKITANGKSTYLEGEAEAHSMCLAEHLQPYSEVKLIKNTLSEYWDIIK
jgi:hypothetical protein